MKYVIVLLISVALLLGCDDKPATQTHDDHNHSHGHDHTPKYGGTLIEIGDHFAHIEFVLNGKEGKLTAYLMDGEAENAVRIQQQTLEVTATIAKNSFDFVLEGVASELTGETQQDTSCFSGTADKLKDAKHVDIKVKKVSIKGQEIKEIACHLHPSK